MDTKASNRLAWLRLGGVFAVGGGVSGINITLADLPRLDDVFSVAGLGLALLLYAVGVLIGIRLFERDKSAERPFELYLAIQIPVMKSGLFSYSFASLGSAALIYKGGIEFDVFVAPLGGWGFSVLKPTAFSFGINVLPIVVLVAFRYLRKRSKSRTAADPETRAHITP